MISCFQLLCVWAGITGVHWSFDYRASFQLLLVSTENSNSLNFLWMWDIIPDGCLHVSIHNLFLLFLLLLTEALSALWQRSGSHCRPTVNYDSNITEILTVSFRDQFSHFPSSECHQMEQLHAIRMSVGSSFTLLLTSLLSLVTSELEKCRFTACWWTEQTSEDPQLLCL